MSDPSRIFISYKHADTSTQIAQRLYSKLRVYSEALDLEVYLDDKHNKGGDVWSEEIETELNRMTHFIGLLSDEYWLSEQCQRELLHGVNRFEKNGSVRLLFVLAEKMNPALLTLNKARGAGKLASNNPSIQKLGDLHFLGPFDQNTCLERLAFEDKAKFGDQLEQLISRLRATLGRPG